MTDPTAIPADDHDEPTAAEGAADPVEVQRVEAELAPEEELLEGWLPEATPTDGPAPAP
jgi:hypothetical protein